MQRSTPRIRRKRAYHHGNLREALVEAAFAIARRDGADAITLRAVAAKAGVSAPAAYHHFADKRALVAASAGIAFTELDARLERALATQCAADRRLVALAGAYVAFAVEEPGAFRLVLGAHVAELDLAAIPETGASGHRAKTRIRDAAAAFAREVGADPELLFRMVWAQALGTAMLVLEKELDPRGAAAPDARAAIELVEDAVARMLAGSR